MTFPPFSAQTAVFRYLRRSLPAGGQQLAQQAKAHLPQLLQLGTVERAVDEQDGTDQNELDDEMLVEHHAHRGGGQRQQKAGHRAPDVGDGAVVILPGDGAVQKHRRVGGGHRHRRAGNAVQRHQPGAHRHVDRHAQRHADGVVVGAAGDGVAVDGALDQDGKHRGEHHHREKPHTGDLVREDQKDDVLEHDQRAEKAEHQKVQHIVDAADAGLLGAVVGVDVGAPVGGKARLHRGDQLGQRVGKLKQALGGRARPRRQKGQADRPVQRRQNCRRGQQHAVGQKQAVGALVGFQRLEAHGGGGGAAPGGAHGAEPEGDGHAAEPRQRRRDEGPDVGGEKARQQVDQVQAGVHPQRLHGVGLYVIFQPQQDVDVPHQHVEGGVQKQKRHQRGVALPQAEGHRQRGGKEHAGPGPHHQHHQKRKPHAGQKHPAAGGAFRRLAVKAQERLVQPQHAQVHQRHGVGHKGGGHGVGVGGQDALDDQRRAADEKAQVGGDRIFHHVAHKALGFGGFLLRGIRQWGSPLLQ